MQQQKRQGAAGLVIAVVVVIGIGIGAYFLFFAGNGAMHGTTAQTENGQNTDSGNSQQEQRANQTNIIIDVPPHHVTVELDRVNSTMAQGSVVSDERMHYILPSAQNTPYAGQGTLQEAVSESVSIYNVTLTSNATALQRISTYNKQFLNKERVNFTPPSLISHINNSNMQSIESGDIAVLTVNTTEKNTSEIVTIDRIANPDVAFSFNG